MKNKMMKHFAALTGIDLHAFDVALKDFEHPDRTFCSRCPKPCEYGKTHLYGCYESVRWDNQYIYYCPLDLIFVAIPLCEEYGILRTGVIAGPILMGEEADFADTYGVPHMDTPRVNDLAQIASAVFAGQIPRTLSESKGSFLNTVYSELDKLKARPSYPFALEKELQSAIVIGNEAAAREHINRLFGEIFFRSNGDFATVKARALELLVLLSRSAIEGGADTEQIFALNGNCIRELNNFRDAEALGMWLSGIVNRFISYVFELGDVKHSVTIRQITGYIRNHYAEKITLDDIAEHIYMSKSHVSKIFNEEMNMNISSFINKIRVEKSKHLLCDPSLTIARIANLTGFDDQSYFTKQFKSETGISPKQFRERLNASQTK